MRPPARRWRTPVLLALFAVAYATAGVYSYARTSATWDEPIHLTAGYAALAHGDYRTDPSHPPLLRMWAALPLLWRNVAMDAGAADRVSPAQWVSDAYRFSHRFLYIENDADDLLYAARFMTLLLGVLLGILVFMWARAWIGWAGAAIALACYALEPNLLAHATLVTTDFGVTCFMFGALYFLWRTTHAFTPGNVAAFACFFMLTVTSKFSGMMLGPIVLVLLAIAVRRSNALTFGRAAVLTVGLAVASIAALWAVYGFRYEPSATGAWIFEFRASPLTASAPRLSAATGWLDAHRVLPNALLEGIFYMGASLRQMPAFLAGAISTEGWWYYFPIAFLIKTPVALLVLIVAGLAASVRRWRTLGDGALFVLVPAALYAAVAMSSGVNLGLRHILPIFPLLIMVAGAGALELLRLRRAGPAAVALVAVAFVAEVAPAYPNTLTFFNRLVGGPGNGHHYLLDSNLSWGQSLKSLAAWMRQNRVDHVNLAYFGQADPAYYGIRCTHLPGAPSFATDAIARPTLPGYVAISETTLHGVYSPAEWRLFYAPFERLEPVAVIDNAIRVYWIDEWPQAVGPLAAGAAPAAHRRLADALLYGLRWPAAAIAQYEEYLDDGPADTTAMINYGVALVSADRVAEGVHTFERAVAADQAHVGARMMLTRALLGQRDFEGAVRHGQRASQLMPGNAEAHMLVGRALAAQGRLDRAADEFQAVLALAPGDADARRFLQQLQATGVTPRAGTPR